MKLANFFNSHFCQQSLYEYELWTPTPYFAKSPFSGWYHRYTYRVLQTIQMKTILLCVWAEWAVLGSAKTASKFEYEIKLG